MFLRLPDLHFENISRGGGGVSAFWPKVFHAKRVISWKFLRVAQAIVEARERYLSLSEKRAYGWSIGISPPLPETATTVDFRTGWVF